MLLELVVKDFAIIENLRLTFGPGLNVLSGETGAGKSIIVGALEVLVGARASEEMISTGAQKAVIQGLFRIARLPRVKERLTELGWEVEDELLITRELSRGGANRVRINGQLATVGVLKRISPLLIDIHGQHEHQSIFSPDEQRRLLDGFGGNESQELLKKISACYNRLGRMKAELHQLVQDREKRAEQRDLLAYQIKELEQSNIQLDEEVKLESEHCVLANTERLHRGAMNISTFLGGGGMEQGFIDRLSSLVKELEEMAAIDASLSDNLLLLRESYYQLMEVNREMRAYGDGLVFDSAKLEAVEDRLGELNRLQRKYGPTLDDVMAYYKKILGEYRQLVGSDTRLAGLKEQENETEKEYSNLALALHERRKETADMLAKLLVIQLEDLAMGGTAFAVEFKSNKQPKGVEVGGARVQPYNHGIDQVEFMISTNPGEELKPLHKIVSGGEISRIMLAFKTVIAGFEQVPTMVFDEIDTGIGGRTAHMVAEKLTAISMRRQVLVITHLPHIASMADQHFFIDKTLSGGKSKTTVTCLDREQKERELARMLEGSYTDTALAHAREMLKSAALKKDVKRR